MSPPDAASASQTPLPILAMRLALDLIDKIGPDGFLLFMVIVRAQDEIFFRRGVGFYRKQLCELCGFPTTNFRRLSTARQSLLDAGLVQCRLPDSDRTQAVYWVGDWTNINRQNGPTEQVTCSQNGLSEQVQCSQNGPTPSAKMALPPGQNGITPRAKMASPPVLLPNTLLPNTPLPPFRGNLFENDLDIEACVPREQQTLPTSDPAPAAETCPNQTPPLEAAEEKFRLDETLEPKANRAKSHSRFSPPSLEDVTAYCRERNNTVDPEQWLNHYQANGWMVGRSKMRDWQAAVRTWEKPKTQQPTKGPSNAKSNQPAYRAERYVPGPVPKTGFESHYG